MKGDTLVGAGQVRQRLSQGYYSGSEDLEGSDVEDDAKASCSPVPIFYRAQTRYEVLQNILWLLFAAYFIYMGDFQSNMIFLLWRDERIKRIALYLGLVVVFLNAVIILWTSVKIGTLVSELNYEVPSAELLIILLGTLSFLFFSCALWPIWSFLTLPLLFTLFMALLVLVSHLPIGRHSRHDFLLHADSFSSASAEKLQRVLDK